MGVTDDEIQKARASTSGSTGMAIGGTGGERKGPCVVPLLPASNKRKCLIMFLIHSFEAIIRIPEDEKGRDLEG